MASHTMHKCSLKGASCMVAGWWHWHGGAHHTPCRPSLHTDWPNLWPSNADGCHQAGGLYTAQKHARLLVLPPLLLCCSPRSCCVWTTAQHHLSTGLSTR